jgi:hypothetical protein
MCLVEDLKVSTARYCAYLRNWKGVLKSWVMVDCKRKQRNPYSQWSP